MLRPECTDAAVTKPTLCVIQPLKKYMDTDNRTTKIAVQGVLLSNEITHQTASNKT
jgi:hypothetical protein